jgi:hypothetical protein
LLYIQIIDDFFKVFIKISSGLKPLLEYITNPGINAGVSKELLTEVRLLTRCIDPRVSKELLIEAISLTPAFMPGERKELPDRALALN